MVQCPACNTGIDQEFGMVTCDQCNAVFMIDINGEVEVSGDEPGPIDDGPLEDSDDDATFGASESSIDSFSGLSDISAESTGGFDNKDVEDVFVDSENEDLFAAQDDEAGNLEESSLGSFDVNALSDSLTNSVSDPLGESPEEPTVVPAADSSDDFPEADESFFSASDAEDKSDEGGDLEDAEDEWGGVVSDDGPSGEPDMEPVDVSAFADSEASSLDNGDYLYTIQLSRVDSKDIKGAVLGTLSDRKLGLLPKEIMRGLSKGRLQIPDLNPLQAKVILEQLQFLDIGIRWKQRAVVVEEGSDAEL